MENNRELLLSKAEMIIKEAEAHGASQSQAAINLTNLNLTRLANSIIDQNVAERHVRVKALLYFGNKRGSVNFEVFEDADIKDAVSQAASLARISRENEDFKSLPTPKKYPSFNLDSLVCKATYDTTPELRAEYAKLAIDTAHEVDNRVAAVAGYVQNITSERVVTNSLGVEGYEMRTSSDIELTILARDGSEETAGWSGDARRDVRDLKVEEVATIAAEKTVKGFGMKDLSPGEYEVVLEPAAAGGLLFYTSMLGFGARHHQEFMSFLRDRIGEEVFSDKLSLYDNALDERLVGASLFDDEGVPHQKVDLIDKGVVKNLVYDTFTAGKDGVESTGNHAQWWGPAEPIARHIIANEGKSSIEDMVSETKNGVLVTHFHYMNPVNPTQGVLTALTRDGTWYIENGDVKHPLRTLRFTDAIPRFFKDIELVGRYSEFLSTPPIGLVPGLKLPSFRFSGSSKE
ncbi:MAG: TldD/PmbA family protein [Candidatus Thorarchaeota archaeon]|nr:MAG: TldD/PmbA family protein [Candidatus Thorarchaeota archaeon]